MASAGKTSCKQCISLIIENVIDLNIIAKE